MTDKKRDTRAAVTGPNIRHLVARMIVRSGGGHVGASFSIADILAALYGQIMRVSPSEPDLPERDRFVLSKGHSALALYATLALTGYFDESLLETFASDGSPFMNHPDASRIPGVEMSTGSLGHGFPLAVGIALSGQMTDSSWHVFTVLGDGECHEGTVWETAMFASTRGLRNLIAIVDRNGIGNEGPIDTPMNLEPLSDKWRAFGWVVFECNGHDEGELVSTLAAARSEPSGPTVVIAHTVKGLGLTAKIAGTGASHYIKGEPPELKSKFREELRAYL